MSVTIVPEETDFEEIKVAGIPLFAKPEIRSTFLAEKLSDKYNREWLSWEPETLWQTIELDFGTNIHPIVKEKIHAAKALLLVDDFWKEWDIFENIVKALNTQIPNFTLLEGCSPGEMAWAVKESNRLRQHQFSEEVISYIQVNCEINGLLVFPEELTFAQGEMDEQQKKILEIWKEKSGDKDFEIAEDVTGIQLARLNSIRHYVADMDLASQTVEGNA
jgi:hypothetical protein